MDKEKEETKPPVVEVKVIETPKEKEAEEKDDDNYYNLDVTEEEIIDIEME